MRDSPVQGWMGPIRNPGRESHGSIKDDPMIIKNGMAIQKRMPPKTTAMIRCFRLYSCSAHFLNRLIRNLPEIDYTTSGNGVRKKKFQDIKVSDVVY